MNYQEALDYIYSFTDYEQAPRLRYNPANYDLRRMEELLVRLGNPHLKGRSIHIAGTNGKGSVAAMVASVLTASGYTTGLYTSPHLHSLTERIRVDGELIPEPELIDLVEKIKPEVEAVNRKATYGRLTTFELLTALGFTYFNLRGVDFQVVEVGLGGRLDATNVVQPEVCIITSISFDHTDVLGSSLTELATEKASIIKPGCIAVSSPQANEVAQVIEKACAYCGARLVRVGNDVTWQNLGFDSNRQLLRVIGRLDSYELSSPLLGLYQLENAATAVAALEALTERGFNISKDSIIDGLARVSWAGRFQIVHHHPTLVVDSAHNPDSAQKLKLCLEHYFNFDRATLVIGISADKDIAGIVSKLAPIFNKVIVTRSQHRRAMNLSPIVAEFKKHGLEVETAEDIPLALRLALAGGGDLICVTGSLFVAAEAIKQACLRQN